MRARSSSQQRASQTGRRGDRRAQGGVRRQHAAEPVLVQAGRGHQLGKQVEQFLGGQQQLVATVDGRAAQAVDQRRVVEPAETLLAQRRPRAVPDHALEGVPVPARDRDRCVDRPAPGVIQAVQDMDGVIIQMAVAQQPAQAAGAHLRLHGGEVGLVEIECRVEDCLAVITRAEHAIGHQHMEVNVAVEVTAEPMDERSAMWAETSTIRRLAHDGHRSRPLHEKATRKSWERLDRIHRVRMRWIARSRGSCGPPQAAVWPPDVAAGRRERPRLSPVVDRSQRTRALPDAVRQGRR
jgi:hypothetical protein